MRSKKPASTLIKTLFSTQAAYSKAGIEKVFAELLRLAKSGYTVSESELLFLKTNQRYIRYLVMTGFPFNVDQILFLGDYPDATWRVPISIELAKLGRRFTLEEIVRLHNPTDTLGATLAHWLAFKGQIFTLDQILKLGNPVVKYKPDDMYPGDGAWQDYLLVRDVSEAEVYARKRYILHNGATISHIMAREGHRFTDEEIARLGNPVDKADLTIKDWMNREKNTTSS